MEQISVKSVKANGAYKITFKKIMRAALAELRVHKKLAIISFVLYGVAMLLYMFNSTYMFHNSVSGYSARFISSGWGFFFTIVGIIAGFFTALNVFRDMNNQQLCDVSMALPIKASERFFSKLMALFIMQTAPLILSVLGGSSLSMLFTVIGSHAKFEDGTAKLLFTLFFGTLAASMFIMSITVLCTCCCGAVAESSYFSIIMMLIINGLPLSFVYNIFLRSAGYNSWFSLGTSDNPVDLGWWGFLFLAADFDDVIPHCVVGILISLAVMLLSGLIYKKRDARSVGKPISSKVFFEVVMAGSCVTIFSLFAVSSVALWGVLIAGVGYVIINIIVCRAKLSPLSFLKWAGKYAATLLAFTVLMVITIKTGAFGYINARPAAKFLEGAKFTVSYYEKELIDNDYRYVIHDIKSQTLTSEQADEVMEICKKHIVKGRADVSAADVIFDVSFGKNSSPVQINANSETEFGFRPSPQSQFREVYNYIESLDTSVTSYVLRFHQNLVISNDESRAMADELMELGYFYDKNQYKDPAYTEPVD